MIPRTVARRLRPMWFAAAASAAWANRDDLRRWASFLRRAVEQRHSRTLSELVTEAKVRVAVSADPLLRRDPELEDVTVHDGVVTLLTTDTWPDSERRFRRLAKVKGIDRVTARNSAAPADVEPITHSRP